MHMPITYISSTRLKVRAAVLGLHLGPMAMNINKVITTSFAPVEVNYSQYKTSKPSSSTVRTVRNILESANIDPERKLHCLMHYATRWPRMLSTIYDKRNDEKQAEKAAAKKRKALMKHKIDRELRLAQRCAQGKARPAKRAALAVAPPAGP